MSYPYALFVQMRQTGKNYVETAVRQGIPSDRIFSGRRPEGEYYITKYSFNESRANEIPCRPGQIRYTASS